MGKKKFSLEIPEAIQKDIREQNMKEQIHLKLMFDRMKSYTTINFNGGDLTKNTFYYRKLNEEQK
jgi:hypothetical protein